ncbi:MAG: ABC transporter permease [Phaeodactylibacter sp.]|nr:ABC transporter permease [Phaeodactylibacter sp.]
MFRNYLKIAWRNLWNNRFFTLINLSGLSVGVAVSLALLLFVHEELSFDKYHENSDRIVRIGVIANYDDTEEKWAQVPNIAGPTFQEKIGVVEEQARFLRHNFGRTAFLRVDGQNFLEEDLYWADSTLFNIFDVEMVYGQGVQSLSAPNQVILSRSTTEKIFKEENPVGKILEVDNDLKLEITGVFEDFPANSTLDAAIIGSFNTLKWASERLYWSNCSFETFLLLHPNADLNALELSMNQVLDEAVKKEDQWFSFWLQPLEEVHLYSKGVADFGYSSRMGEIKQVQIMIVLALSVLLLACFNYINMTTARSQQRLREVGINKTLGASRGQMVRRFFVETGILVALAMLLGIMLVQLSLPLFESLTGRTISAWNLLEAKWIAVSLGVWALITFGAGLYPAFFLSNFSPKDLLQPQGNGLTGHRFFRHTLVIGQFAVCIALITAALVFNRQLEFMGKKKLGFQPEQVIALNMAAAEEVSQIESLTKACQNLSFVESASRVQGFPGMQVSGYSMQRPGQEQISTGVASNHVSPGFEKVLQLKFIAGRTLSEKLADDTTIQVVMNKTGVDFLGWTPEEAIGKRPPNLYNNPSEIVGVVEDFHFESMHNPIGAYVFTNGSNLGRRPFLLLKLNTTDLPFALQQLERTFSQHLPKSAFDYTFLDDHTQRLYSSERRLSTVVMIFTFLTIFISCLGLFGLATFTVERRTKEIGIRKVLGSSVPGLVGLLARQFMQPVIIGLLLAAPIAFYFINQWLQNFAYRIDMNVWYMALAGGIAILIAFVTVSVQSLRAALANPVDSLRSE